MIKSAKQSALRTNLIQFAVMVVVATVIIALMLWAQAQNERNAARYYAEEQAKLQAAAKAFVELPPAQALAMCREQWHRQLSWSNYYQPQAIAWSRFGVDAYYLQGTDASSLRHLRCEPDGTVRRGLRYVRPGMANLQAERSSEAVDTSNWVERELMMQVPEADLVALEIMLLPDQRVATRRWRGAEQLQATSTPADAAFPTLLQQPAPSVPGELLTPLPKPAANGWLRAPQAAFEVLKKSLPADARILKLRLADERIDITIAGPIPAFDNDPPAPSGDMEYDEYGIADRSWWYPREIFPGECRSGQSLEAVTRGFISQWQEGAAYLSLNFDCKHGFMLKQPR